MKEIKLTKGYVTIVDDDDFEYLSRWKWHACIKSHCVYAKRAVKKNDEVYAKGQKVLSMHRAILMPSKDMEIDHINHDGLDNRKVNLRIVTKRENHWNRTNNSSFIGVVKSRNVYRARIRVNNKKRYIGGAFETPELAAEVYKSYAENLL